jgi:hypothetical protein
MSRKQAGILCASVLTNSYKDPGYRESWKPPMLNLMVGDEAESHWVPIDAKVKKELEVREGSINNHSITFGESDC